MTENDFYLYRIHSALLHLTRSQKPVILFIPARTIGMSFFGDFLRIIHERNRGAAFSLGHGFPDSVRFILLSIVPLAILVWLVRYIIVSDEPSRAERWLMSGIAGVHGKYNRQAPKTWKELLIFRCEVLRYFWAGTVAYIQYSRRKHCDLRNCLHYHKACSS